MSLTILIPVKSFAEGKSRLSGVMDAKARATLCRRLLDHVLAVATDAALDADVHVVSACQDVRQYAAKKGVTVHREQRVGHIAALADTMPQVPQDRPLLILSADLPGLTVDDLRTMRAAGVKSDVVIATDREGQGTNALLMTRPGVIPLRFGTGSCPAHRREADAVGLTSQIVSRAGLAEDLDLPKHLKILVCGA